MGNTTYVDDLENIVRIVRLLHERLERVECNQAALHRALVKVMDVVIALQGVPIVKTLKLTAGDA